MRIAHIVDSMEVGGAETVVALLCRKQREQGHEPSVHTHLRLGRLADRLMAEGFRVDLQGPAKLPHANWNFYRLFRELRPEVVHCHNPTATMYAAPAARLAGVRRVISTRHSLVAPPHNRQREFKYGCACRFCDAIVGICDITCVNTRRAPYAPRGRVLRIYNGVDALRAEPGATTVAKSGFTIVYVGRLAAVKDLGTLIRAFADARKQAGDLRLWIVGDGPSRGELESLVDALGARDGTTFFGEQLGIERFFAQADVFAMSSVSEGLPMSLLQAMSMGVPAVVTDVGGMAEVVRLSGSGLISGAGDVPGMTESMLRMRADAKMRECMGARAREAFAKYFTADEMAAEYLKLYSEGA